MTKNLKILLLVLIIILLGFGAFVFYYSFQSKSPPLPPGDLGALREAKLREMSESLTIQAQTPQFKSKLAEMSKSLNK